MDPREFTIDPGTVDPRRAAAILDESLPSEVGVVHGTATAPASRRSSCASREMTWAINTFGCIGQAVPTAIGAAVAGTPMAVVDGDSRHDHASELDTAAGSGSSC